MARTTNTYVVRPETQAFPAANPWTQTGEGLVNAFTGEEPDGFGTHGLLEANRVSQLTTNKKKVTGKWTLPTLATGEIVVSAVAHAYCRSLSSKDLTFNFTNGLLFESSATTTEPLWVKSSVVSMIGKTLAEILPEYEIENTKAAGGHVYAIYIVLTTETERTAQLSGGAGASSGESGTASAGGTKELAGRSGWAAGRTILLKIDTISPGTIAVTDSEGNTWTKDLEVANGTLTVQLWRANLTKGLLAGQTIKIAGFAASAKLALNWLTTLGELNGVDTFGTATGTGTTVEATTAASLRASQGDFVTAGFGTPVEATFTKDGAEAWVLDSGGQLKQAGLSLGGEWNGTPTEGAAITAKPKFGTEGAWAGFVIAYKVLATAGKTTYEQAVAIKAGTVPSLTAVKTATQTLAAITGTTRTYTAIKVAQQAVTLTDGARMALAAQRAAQQAVTGTTGAVSRASGAKVATASSTITAGTTAVLASKLVGVSKPASRAGVLITLTIAGQKTVEQAVSSRTGARLTLQAVKVAAATSVLRTGARSTISSKLVAQSAVTFRTGARFAYTSRLVGTARINLTAGVLVRLTTIEALAGPPVTIILQGRAQTTISLTGRPRTTIQTTGRARTTITTEGR